MDKKSMYGDGSKPTSYPLRSEQEEEKKEVRHQSAELAGRKRSYPPSRQRQQPSPTRGTFFQKPFEAVGLSSLSNL